MGDCLCACRHGYYPCGPPSPEPEPLVIAFGEHVRLVDGELTVIAPPLDIGSARELAENLLRAADMAEQGT